MATELPDYFTKDPRIKDAEEEPKKDTFAGDHKIFIDRPQWAYVTSRRPSNPGALHVVRPYPYHTRIYCGGDLLNMTVIRPSERPTYRFYVCPHCARYALGDPAAAFPLSGGRRAGQNGKSRK